MAGLPTLIVPTRRAALLLALAAPLALVVAATSPHAWIAAPLLGLAVLALVVADALSAGGLQDVRVVAPGDVEVGAADAIEVAARFAGGRRRLVEAALSGDARLLPDGRGEFSLHGDGTEWRGEFAMTPSRRGTGTLDMLWLRWRGPLGLGARQARQPLREEVRVWPNIGLVRSPALQAFLRDAQFGLIARRMRGEGSQFEALTEYQPGMDRRRIDWKASARHLQLYAKEFETERNNQIVFAIDCGQAMCAPIGGMTRLDRAVSAALATAWVALKSGDRAALFGFAASPQVLTPFVAATQQFHQLQRGAAAMEYHAQEANFTLAMATLAQRLQRRSMIVVFSDFTDPTSAALMTDAVARLTARHLVLFVTMEDAELEGMAQAEPADMQALAMAVTADSLLRQREVVRLRLRQLGADVLEAPHDQIGTRLIDAYLAAKRGGVIG